MLAERKSRVKWSQDPRNTFWSNGSKAYKSKYGYRMLERMGWKEGKGLGANEEGTREHVKVKKKEDSLGLGAKKGRDDDWIEHQDSFDQLLAHLNSQQSSENKASCGTDDEAKTTTTKTLVDSATESKRIMYKRFLRSKDLSVVSSADLDCVLGRKKRKLTDKPPDNEHILDSSPSKVDVPDATHGITTVTSTKSVKDYFTDKLDKLDRRTSSEKAVKSKSLGRTKKSKQVVKKRKT